jgi:hypothetical protein
VDLEVDLNLIVVEEFFIFDVYTKFESSEPTDLVMQLFSINEQAIDRGISTSYEVHDVLDYTSTYTERPQVHYDKRVPDVNFILENEQDRWFSQRQIVSKHLDAGTKYQLIGSFSENGGPSTSGMMRLYYMARCRVKCK